MGWKLAAAIVLLTTAGAMAWLTWTTHETELRVRSEIADYQREIRKLDREAGGPYPGELAEMLNARLDFLGEIKRTRVSAEYRFDEARTARETRE